MTVSFSSAKALLASEAVSLSSEANNAGLSSLSSALTDLASEISGSSPNYYEFFGGTLNTYNTSTGAVISSESYMGVANVWANTLQAAAQTIADHNQKTIVDKQTIIADQITSIATDTTVIKNTLGTINGHLSNVSSQMNVLSTNSTIIKNLAIGTGIHMVGPYDWIGFATLYNLYIEQGKLNDRTLEVSAADQAAALSRLQGYLDKLRSLPTLY